MGYVPYSVIVTWVSEVMGFVVVKFIWKAIDTKLYASDKNRYAVMVAAHRQAMSCTNLRGGWPLGERYCMWIGM